MSRVITGEALRNQRKRLGMSQADVAKLMTKATNQKTVANWEAGQVPPSREAEVREKVFFSEDDLLLDRFSGLQLLGALVRKLSRAESRVEELEAMLAVAQPEERWVGARPPRRTRATDDTPGLDT